MGKLVWLLMMICNCLAFWSNLKAWSEDEVIHSRNGSFASRKIRREDDPAEFQAYMTGMFLLNAVFFITVIILGFFAFREYIF